MRVEARRRQCALALCTQVLDQPSLLTSAQRVKAHYRRHQAHLARLEHEEALEELAICEQLDPKNEDVRMALTAVKWAKRLADRAQREQFGGMFSRRGADSAGGGDGGGRRAEAAGKDAAVTEADEGVQSTELYRGERGIPRWLGEPPTGSTSPWTAPCWAAW